MKFVYLLQHTHEFDADREDVKVLGVYSTKTEADTAILRFLNLPGFCDAPEGFSVAQLELDKDEWREGYFTTGEQEE